jgi:hypothetical protein
MKELIPSMILLVMLADLFPFLKVKARSAYDFIMSVNDSGNKRRSEGSDLSESPNGSPQSGFLSCSLKGGTLKSVVSYESPTRLLKPMIPQDTPKKPPRRKLPNNLSKIVQSDVEEALKLHQNGIKQGDAKDETLKRRASLPMTETQSQSHKSVSAAENNNNVSKESKENSPGGYR